MQQNNIKVLANEDKNTLLDLLEEFQTSWWFITLHFTFVKPVRSYCQTTSFLNSWETDGKPKGCCCNVLWFETNPSQRWEIISFELQTPSNSKMHSLKPDSCPFNAVLWRSSPHHSTGLSFATGLLWNLLWELASTFSRDKYVGFGIPNNNNADTCVDNDLQTSSQYIVVEFWTEHFTSTRTTCSLAHLFVNEEKSGTTSDHVLQNVF